MPSMSTHTSIRAAKAFMMVLCGAAMLTLALVRARPVHYVLVPLLLVVMVLGWFPLRIR